VEVKDALNRITQSRYDDKGQLVETLYPDATPANAADNPRTITVYDKGGRQRATLDESGRVTHYRYNDSGNLVETIYPLETDTLAQFVAAVAPGKTPQTVDWTQVVYPDAVPTYLDNNPRTADWGNQCLGSPDAVRLRCHGTSGGS
jgi:large repetitive protein